MQIPEVWQKVLRVLCGACVVVGGGVYLCRHVVPWRELAILVPGFQGVFQGLFHGLVICMQAYRSQLQNNELAPVAVHDVGPPLPQHAYFLDDAQQWFLLTGEWV